MSEDRWQAHSDPYWYTSTGLPPEVRAYDTPLDDLGVGCAGKVGVLDLGLVSVRGRTRIARQYQQSPLYTFHPMYIDARWPGMAFVYLHQAGEGMVQGDRYRVELDCAADTAVHFTTPAATKIYRMDNSFAGQIVNLTVAAGSHVEYLPGPVIPFRGSRYYQRVRLTVDPGATVIYGEILLPGRVARDEAHVYALYYTDLEAHASDGTLLWADRLKLAPGSISPRSPGLLGPFEVLATLYVMETKIPASVLVERLRACLPLQPGLVIGASELPNHCGAVLRMVGRTSAVVATAMHTAWNEARLALVGLPAPDLRAGWHQ